MENKYLEMYKLRKEGKIYSEIAKKFGITHQGVQWILTKYFPKIRLVKNTKNIKKKCLGCNKIFLVYKKQLKKRIYCSGKCWLKVHTQNGTKSTPEYKRKRKREYRRKYYKTKKGNKIVKRIAKQQQTKFKEKTDARQLLNLYVKFGKIRKPKKCSNCGQSKLRITGHHHDYKKPLEVVWLCDFCHHSLHKKY